MAWFAVGTAAMMLAVIMGTLVNGLTAFFVPMEQAEGWARADVAGINSFGLLGLAIGSVAMGFVTSRLSMRTICLIAASATGIGLIVASQAGSLWLIYAVFFMAGLLGGGTLFAPIFVYVGNWFPRGAGLAIGIAAAGQAVGQGGVPFLAAWLIDAAGWRTSMLVLGVGTLALLVPLALFMRQPSAAGVAAALSEPPLKPAVAVPILSVAVFLCCTCMAVPLMHLMPLIQSFCIPSTDAGSVMLVMLLAAIAGRVAYGKLCDLIGSTSSWLVASALQTVGVLAFSLFTTLPEFAVFAAVYGFAYAGVMTSLPGHDPRPDAVGEQGGVDGDRLLVRLARSRVRRLPGCLRLRPDGGLQGRLRGRRAGGRGQSRAGRAASVVHAAKTSSAGARHLKQDRGPLLV